MSVFLNLCVLLNVCCPVVLPQVIPNGNIIIGVEGMSAVLSFITVDAFPLVTDNNVRWLLTRQGVTRDITNLTMIDNNTLTFEYNMTAQIFSLNISNIQPNYTSQFNLTVTNPAGVDTDFIDFIIAG